MVDYTKAIPMYINPAWMFTNARPHFAIILHKTAGFHSAYDAARYFQNGSDGNHVSSHYIVGQDGTVIQCVPEQHGAGGNGIPDPSPNRDAIWDQFINAGININTITISLEHIDPATDNSTPLTPAQKEASFALIKDIATRHGIDAHHIFGHDSICKVNRAQCPGNYPWQELWAYLTPPITHIVSPVVVPHPIVQPKEPIVTQAETDDANVEWAIFFAENGKNAPAINTGIYKSWLDKLHIGKRLGPCITHEYASHDWQGGAITVQQFAHARAEWSSQSGTCRWFNENGELV